MSQIHSRLASLLHSRQVPYQLIDHAPDFSARRAAVDTNTPACEFAKAVLVEVDGRVMMAVVPADRAVDMVKLGIHFQAREVELADEEVLADLCSDSEVGAEPPFGSFYGIPVMLDAELCGTRTITFNAGTHTEAVRMLTVDYLKLVSPRVMDIAD